MEPKFQTSFIPKSPITTSTVSSVAPTMVPGSINFLSLVGYIVFSITLVSYGGLFAYDFFLHKQIDELDKKLVFAEQAFDVGTIKNLVTASDQIKSATNLLKSHVAVSNMFDLFQSNILPGVRFSTFEFTQTQEGAVKISVVGEGQSYPVLAEQARLLSVLPVLKNQTFIKLDLTEKGLVSMRYEAVVDTVLLGYKGVGVNASSVAPQVPVVATSTMATTTVPATVITKQPLPPGSASTSVKKI